MVKRKRVGITRAVTLVASVALVIGLMPAAAFAQVADSLGGQASGAPSADAGGVTTVSSLQAAIVDGIQAADGQMTAQGVSAQGSSKKGMEAIQKIITCAVVAAVDPEEAAAIGAEWLAESFCEEVLGISLGGGDEEALKEILAGIERLQEELNTLQQSVNSKSLDDVLNSLIPLLGEQTTSDVYYALAKIDAMEGTGDLKQQYRMSALTGDLGIDEAHWESVENTYDKFVERLWTAMTTEYNVTINGKAQSLTLLQIQYEHLRYKHRWEHQAYDEWADYQAQCIGLLMTSLALEKHSLQARIQLLKDKHPERDTGAVEGRLLKVQNWLNIATGFKGKDPNGNPVNYPGLFSDKTWASQYWMYKERPDERYYWVPGHEILFYAKVNTQNVPHEKKGVGAYDKKAQGYDYWTSGYGKYRHTHHRVKFNFWKPFVRYQGGNTLLASARQLQMVYKDYGSSTHLYDIFMSKNEGNFQGLKEGNITTWWFVVDPDSDHPLTYEDNGLAGADKIYCYVLRSANAKQDEAILCKYHNRSNEPNTNTHYIGIGVKRVGPETYDPDNSRGDGVKPVANTATSLTKTFGDSSFTLGMKASKGAKLTYKSSNKKVVKVSKAGKVTIKGAGTARIKVTNNKKPLLKDFVIIKVKKAKNSIVFKGKTATVDSSKLKDAKQTVAINKATKAKGKVTYSITKAVKGKKSFKSNFGINKKTGKITVKQGTKKGTYKVTVKAQAKGTKNYKAVSKKAVITIRVS